MAPVPPKVTIGMKADASSIGPEMQAAMQAQEQSTNPVAPPMPTATGMNEEIATDPSLDPNYDAAASPHPGGDAQEEQRLQLPGTALSTDVVERQPAQMVSQAQDTPSLQDDVGAGDPTDPNVKKAMEQLFGSDFPLLKDAPDARDWAQWAKGLWSRHRSGVEMRLHLIERNRLMRRDVQWLSSQGLGPWREPVKPKDATRAVDNVIKPALDQRLQIISEQRPGFRTRPETQDQKDMKRAEAQQVALEYQYTQQGMQKILREACYWNGTDGVSFFHLYWNPDRGPWDDIAVPDKTGQALQVMNSPLGDIECCVLRMEEVRVSSESSATKKPNYWVVRKTIPTADAVQRYGAAVVDASGEFIDHSLQTDSALGMRVGLGSTLPDALFRDQPTVDEYTIYCDKSEFLKQGLTIKVVGGMVISGPMPLVYGVVPMVRITDGGTDPNFYPEAIMEGWIDSQMRINALKSKWIDSIRVNAGGRFLAKENTLSTETLIGGMTSYISVKGPGALNDSVKAVDGFSVGNDVKELLEIERKAFEDRSGWNDTSRGSFSADQSGRAILAIREQLERAFAPPVNAAAEAMTTWAEISIAIMKWGYDFPRAIAVQGQGRPDLAREISSVDIDGVANVTIDAETLMPMPRALRLFLLDSLLQKQLITPDEYKRRLPFAFTNNLNASDQDQYSRAQRVVQAIKETGNPQALPLLWQDDEAVHQDALERELILPDDLPIGHPVRQAALARWQLLAQQAMMKMGGVPPTAAPQQAHPVHGAAGTKQLSPVEQPFAGTNPSVASGSAANMGGQADQQNT